MSIHPFKDRVLIQPINQEISKGGIFIPEKYQQKGLFVKGKVLEFGNKVTDLKIGDIVIYQKHIGFEVNGDILIKKEFILGVEK